MLEANGCEIPKLNQEFRSLHSHVVAFLSKSTNEQTWQQLFQLQRELALKNILHIAEICIVLPISSADVERVFSSFARTLTKERMSLKKQTIEYLLIIRSDKRDIKTKKYSSIIDKFLTENPDGSIRKKCPTLSDFNQRNQLRRDKDGQSLRKKNCLFLPNIIPNESLSEIEPVVVEGASESEDDEYLPVNVDDIDLEFISDTEYDSDSDPGTSSSMDEL